MKKGLGALACLFVLAMLVPNYSFAQLGFINLIKSGGVFAAADMQGTWYTYGTGYGIFTVDNFGNVTGGAVYNDVGVLDNITGGSINLNGTGMITGNMTWTSGVTSTFPAGKVDFNKEITAAAFSESNGGYGYLAAIKGGGAFATADLQGTWYFQGYNSMGSAFVGWGTVNNMGAITGGQLNFSSGGTVNLTGGNISSNAAGIVTGNIVDSSGDTITLFHGKIAANKSFMMGSLRSANTGAYVHMQATKYGGAFATSDLAGTWYGYGMESTPDAGYLTAVFDNAGNLTSGTMTSVRTGQTSNLGSGSFTLDSNGILDGTLSALQLMAAEAVSENYRVDEFERSMSQGGWATVFEGTESHIVADDNAVVERAVQTYAGGKMDINKQFIGAVYVPTTSGGGGGEAAGASSGGGGGGCFVSSLID